MDTSNIISLAALVVAISALPISYFTAVRQVKIELNEHDRHQKRKARLLVADRIDEFATICKAGLIIYCGNDKADIEVFKMHIAEIDVFVRQTGILDRLVLAIDDLGVNGYAGLPKPSKIVANLQTIRNIIALGSSNTRYVTLSVLSVLSDYDLSKELRQ